MYWRFLGSHWVEYLMIFDNLRTVVVLLTTEFRSCTVYVRAP